MDGLGDARPQGLEFGVTRELTDGTGYLVGTNPTAMSYDVMEELGSVTPSFRLWSD